MSKIVGMALTEDLKRLEESSSQITNDDAAVHDAELRIAKYFETHPNLHAMRISHGSVIVHLNAMNLDPQLTLLEANKDEAKERFARTLNEHAELKKRLFPEEVQVGGHKRS